MIWTGRLFVGLGHRDGRFLHPPGQYGFARRDADQGALRPSAGRAEFAMRAPAEPSRALAPAIPCRAWWVQ